MQICGIIAEYNPFHLGHAHHIAETRRKMGAEGIMAVMSGSFTQRGAPALTDKWTRARMAVEGGANLVLELPFCFACGSAEYFAGGGIRLLAGTGCVQAVSFGVEGGPVQMPAPESADAKETLRQALRLGNSYPAAVYAAAKEAGEALPNRLLALEYLRAVQTYAPALEACQITRQGAGYHSLGAEGGYLSATGARALFFQGKLKQLREYLPASAARILEQCYAEGRYAKWENLSAYALGFLRRGETVLRGGAYVGEGLEHRFYRAACEAKDLGGLLERVKTKRYPYARLARILANALVGLSAEELSRFTQNGPGYLRVLAADETGERLLKEMKKHASLPIITRAGQAKQLPELSRKMFELDCRAADIFALAFENPSFRGGKTDYTRKFTL